VRANEIYATGILRDAPESTKPLAVPVKTACKLVGVSNTTVWAFIKTGRVKSVSIGRRRLVIYASLESLLAPGAGGA
jgi:excisionase family DNA binding protein